MRRHSKLSFLAGGALTAAVLLSLAPVPAHAGAPETVQIFRRYRDASGDHLPTNNPNEGNSYGYVTESSMLFYTEPYGGGGNTPAATYAVYRCLRGGWDHMLSLSSTCEGTAKEGRLGYLLRSSRSGHVPVYRCRNDARSGEHFWSSASNCEGFANEGLLGYALPSSQQGSRSLFNKNSVNNDCLGKCGWKCSWMPFNAYTAECRVHDECVRDNGLVHCMDGRFLDAALSYYIAYNKSMYKGVVSAVEAVADWF